MQYATHRAVFLEKFLTSKQLPEFRIRLRDLSPNRPHRTFLRAQAGTVTSYNQPNHLIHLGPLIKNTKFLFFRQYLREKDGYRSGQTPCSAVQATGYPFRTSPPAQSIPRNSHANPAEIPKKRKVICPTQK